VVLRTALVCSVVLALVAVELGSRSGVMWRLVTFTYQANLLAAAYYAWTLASPKAHASAGLRGAVVLYVVVAGLIWNMFLTGHSMGYTPANLLLHVAVPVLALADWLLIGRGMAPVRWWQPFAWLVYPAAYGVLALVVLGFVATHTERLRGEKSGGDGGTGVPGTESAVRGAVPTTARYPGATAYQ